MTVRYMQTYTSRRFYPARYADELQLSVVDIAHALSMTCRFGGHCLSFYSVAEHSCHIADWLAAQGEGRSTAFAGLMHDAPEAYLGDIPTALKVLLPDYRRIEDALWKHVAASFGIPEILPLAVKEADLRILIDERDALMHGHDPDGWPKVERLGIRIRSWAPEEARRQFTYRFETLCEVP